jgi:hypothetical protein
MEQGTIHREQIRTTGICICSKNMQLILLRYLAQFGEMGGVASRFFLQIKISPLSMGKIVIGNHLRSCDSMV